MPIRARGRFPNYLTLLLAKKVSDMDYLVFQLYGAMASWGEPAVGGNRPTSSVPSRSAILGLMASALGIKRECEEELQALQHSVVIAVKQYAPGTVIADFHTVQVPSSIRNVTHRNRRSELQEKKLNTILSRREYCCDGLWVIAISLSEKASESITLKIIEDALKKPKFMLYMGRKSCPLANPLQPQIIQSATLREALDTPFIDLTAKQQDYARKDDMKRLFTNGSVSYFWELNKLALGVDVDQIITTYPWDEPINRSRWQFKQRKQYCYIAEEAM